MPCFRVSVLVRLLGKVLAVWILVRPAFLLGRLLSSRSCSPILCCVFLCSLSQLVAGVRCLTAGYETALTLSRVHLWLFWAALAYPSATDFECGV